MCVHVCVGVGMCDEASYEANSIILQPDEHTFQLYSTNTVLGIRYSQLNVKVFISAAMFISYLPSVVISHIVESVVFLLIAVFFFIHSLLLALLFVGGVPTGADSILLLFSVSGVRNVFLEV